jgi:hypothetical protein
MSAVKYSGLKFFESEVTCTMLLNPTFFMKKRLQCNVINTTHFSYFAQKNTVAQAC